jgi:hypothetical protein
VGLFFVGFRDRSVRGLLVGERWSRLVLLAVLLVPSALAIRYHI